MRDHPRKRPALACESLEGRDCPAGQIFSFAGFVTVVGDGTNNAVAVTDNGAGNVDVTVDGTKRSLTNVRGVSVLTFGGDDTVTYTVTGAQTGNRSVAVAAGDGNDTVRLTAGAVGGRFGFAVVGGDGNDTLAATVGAVAAGGSLTVGLDGGRGTDGITATATGKLDGVLTLGLGGGADNDTVTGTVTADTGSAGRVTAAVAGGAGADKLTLNVAGGGAGTLAKVYAVLDGGRDSDTDTAVNTPNVQVFNIP